MDAIKAKIRNDCIEVDCPLNLPEGTELLVYPDPMVSDAENTGVDGEWDDSPEGIADWLSWYDSLQPFVFTADEQKMLAEDRQSRKEWECAKAGERAEKLQRLWE